MRSRGRILLTVVFLSAVLLSLVLVEELHYGFLRNVYGNFYFKVVYLPFHLRRSVPEGSRRRVALVVIMNRTADLLNYPLAQWSLGCYATLHDYPLIRMAFSSNHTLRKLCPHGDFTFARHCAMALVLSEHSDLDYFLFLDADMGVINPSHLVEEFIPLVGSVEDADLTFYERLFNYEIMAGTYLAKRTAYAIDFLRYWADYYYRVEKKHFHGWDNGVINKIFLDRFCGSGNCSRMVGTVCERLWNNTRSFASLSYYASCTRYALGDRNLFHDASWSGRRSGSGKVALRTIDGSRTHESPWARDGWLTGNSWAPGDFILHGWQERYKDAPSEMTSWHSPLVGDGLGTDLVVGADDCRWPYRDTFMKDDDFIRSALSTVRRRTRLEHLLRVTEILNSENFYLPS